MNKVALVLLLVSFSLAQDKPKPEASKDPAPPTPQELQALSDAQVDIFQANDALVTAKNVLNQIVNNMYASRNINFGDWVLCDGPGVGPGANPVCNGLKKHEKVWRALPKAEAPKKP